VVPGYDYWHGHFRADRGVVGQTVAINKHPFTIVGVAPRGFRGTELLFAPSMWIPEVSSQRCRDSKGWIIAGTIPIL
jgi:hypothetical protein